MLSKEEFVQFIVDGPKTTVSKSKDTPGESALPEGFDSFGFGDQETETQSTETVSFARNLMEASGFGPAQYLDNTEVILGTDPAAKYLPERVLYWPQANDRPYQTLLFELSIKGSQLLKTPMFRPQSRQEILEDALSRFVQCTLEGFSRGGEKRTASTKKGKQTETLCIVSCIDDREETEKEVNLVCFGTVSAEQNSLESFHIREESKYWEPQIRNDHLEKLYKRHFSKLVSDKWQDAFISGEERKLARKLLDICIEKKVNEKQIQESAVGLLEEIAKSFGLTRKGGKGGRRLTAFDLPNDHDIGMDPEKLEKHGGANPFKGMTLRDEKNRLLGYIIYCLDEKKDAVELRNYLTANNRFHNVLIIYPDGDHAELELWQGKVPLAGKLTKQGAKYQGEGEVVNLLSRFFVVSKAKVKNPIELAQELAYRARYLRRLAIKELDEEDDDGPIRNLYNAFKESLVHDQTEEEFADAFAQTLTYGLLTARWMGSEKLTQSGDRFTRQTALTYLPTTSNFLGDLFETALSVKLDEQRGRLLWLVDDIANLLDRIDVNYVFGAGDKDSDQATDPVIHFYEPFLAEYDKDLKNKRGVFFTPRPIVSFIVRSVHELFRKEFGLEDGLASTDTWIDVQKRFPELKLPEGVKGSDQFVRILDPATGTGTFLYECVGLIEKTMKDKWCKELQFTDWMEPEIIERWRDYVSRFLLSRLYGYELMMASYSIGHLKLTFKLAETGYKINEEDRLHIYLTNSLEPPSDIQQKIERLFISLSKEAKEVNYVKKHIKFTAIIGNPPYSRVSQTKNDFIKKLIKDYKKPVADEANQQPLDDDYIKFIRLAHYLQDQTGIGIIGLITNHTVISGILFRGVRECIYNDQSYVAVVDLHGNSNIKEKCLDGSVDENVFDILAGVSITLASRGPILGKKKCCFSECWGTRSEKYNLLFRSGIDDIKTLLTPVAPYFFLKPIDLSSADELNDALPLPEIFSCYSSGLMTVRDKLAIAFEKEELTSRFEMFRDSKISDKEFQKICPVKDYRKWTLSTARKKVQADNKWKDRIQVVNYRPFDKRYIYYSSDIVTYPNYRVMDQFKKKNIGLISSRINKGEEHAHEFITREMVEIIFLSSKSSNNAFVFPLYIHEKRNDLLFSSNGENINFTKKFLTQLQNKLKICKGKKIGIPVGLSPEDIFNYIYAILHSLNYRRRYAELLKIEFPRVPIAADIKLFNKLSAIGKYMIEVHLLEAVINKENESEKNGEEIFKIEKIQFSNESIWVNKKKTVGFKGVSAATWNFHVGGYKVCEKWLKDRKGRTLTENEIEHYQKIIVAISETIRLQAEIDKVIDEHGGWPGAFVTDKGGAS